ncbi:hypothetical protein AC579_10512 [Pseudocercospora musae]|uniref:Uncharacterized protein n=1 Tax=Pseudocercospora musae TaxID=113226 RepID=A0A139I4X5_9PEZI|nr:hypothetical protein AC579_10512 [Pseudocercospora musae]
MYASALEDLERGRTGSQISRWQRILRTGPVSPSAERSQELIDLVSRFEGTSCLARLQLDIDASSYVEYVRERILQDLDRFAFVLPFEVDVDDQKKSSWVHQAMHEVRSSMDEPGEFSVSRTLQYLQDHKVILKPGGGELDQVYLCTELVFFLLGHITTLYLPAATNLATHQLCLDRRYPRGHGTFEEYTNDVIEVEEAARPFRDMLLGFGGLQPTCEHEPSNRVQPIFTSQFNAHVFATIGRIRFEWTDLLPAHLDFDDDTRTLYIYQRPTFCLLNIAAQSQTRQREWKTILARCLESDTDQHAEAKVSEYMQEVLLSTHMIFGQFSKARKTFKSSTGSGNISSLSPDPLLPVLCTGQWPFADLIRRPKKRYVLGQDFPLLGEKLQVIADYTNGSQPTNVWDLWKDKRNPLQWWTFSAVVLVGGFGLLFAILQTALSAAQVHYAARDVRRV